MSKGVTIRFDNRDLSGIRQSLRATQRDLAMASARAINKIATQAQRDASKAIRSQVRLTAPTVNKKLRITQRATPESPVAVISAPRRGVLLSTFRASAIGREPIKVKVKPGGGAKVVSGKPGLYKPFWMVLPYSNVWAIVQRRKTPGPRGGWIEVLYGPSVSQVWRSVMVDLVPQIETNLVKLVAQDLTYLVLRRKS